MSSTVTNSNTPSEVSLPLLPVAADPNVLMQEIAALHSKINEAIVRVTQLENVAGVRARKIIAIDSPAMKSAVDLCAEVFPASRTRVELMTDPDDSNWSWYLITVYWKGSIRESIDQQSVWQARFDALHPEALHDISLFVVPE